MCDCSPVNLESLDQAKSHPNFASRRCSSNFPFIRDCWSREVTLFSLAILGFLDVAKALKYTRPKEGRCAVFCRVDCSQLAMYTDI